MSKALPDPQEAEAAALTPAEQEARRKRIITARNRAVGLVLLGLVVLFFALSIARIGDNTSRHAQARAASQAAPAAPQGAGAGQP